MTALSTAATDTGIPTADMKGGPEGAYGRSSGIGRSVPRSMLKTLDSGIDVLESDVDLRAILSKVFQTPDLQRGLVRADRIFADPNPTVSGSVYSLNEGTYYTFRASFGNDLAMMDLSDIYLVGRAHFQLQNPADSKYQEIKANDVVGITPNFNMFINPALRINGKQIGQDIKKPSYVNMIRTLFYSKEHADSTPGYYNHYNSQGNPCYTDVTTTAGANVLGISVANSGITEPITVTGTAGATNLTWAQPAAGTAGTMSFVTAALPALTYANSANYGAALRRQIMIADTSGYFSFRIPLNYFITQMYLGEKFPIPCKNFEFKIQRNADNRYLIVNVPADAGRVAAIGLQELRLDMPDYVYNVNIISDFMAAVDDNPIVEIPYFRFYHYEQPVTSTNTTLTFSKTTTVVAARYSTAFVAEEKSTLDPLHPIPGMPWANRAAPNHPTTFTKNVRINNVQVPYSTMPSPYCDFSEGNIVYPYGELMELFGTSHEQSSMVKNFAEFMKSPIFVTKLSPCVSLDNWVFDPKSVELQETYTFANTGEYNHVNCVGHIIHMLEGVHKLDILKGQLAPLLNQ